MGRPKGFEPWMDLAGIRIVKRTTLVTVAYQPTAFQFEKAFWHFGSAEEIQAIQTFVQANPVPQVKIDPVTGNFKTGSYSGWVLSAGGQFYLQWLNKRSFIVPELNVVGENFLAGSS
jgi:hypothetical protein